MRSPKTLELSLPSRASRIRFNTRSAFVGIFFLKVPFPLIVLAAALVLAAGSEPASLMIFASGVPSLAFWRMVSSYRMIPLTTSSMPE